MNKYSIIWGSTISEVKRKVLKVINEHNAITIGIIQKSKIDNDIKYCQIILIPLNDHIQISVKDNSFNSARAFHSFDSPTNETFFV